MSTCSRRRARSGSTRRTITCARTRQILTIARSSMLRGAGGPEVLRVEEVRVGAPGPDEVRLRQTVIGVNYHDTYVRSGLYKTLALPGIPGVEAVGVVEAVGARVSGLEPGDRVG